MWFLNCAEKGQHFSVNRLPTLAPACTEKTIVSDLTLTKKVNKHISQMLDNFFSIMLPPLPLQSCSNSNNLNIKHSSYHDQSDHVVSSVDNLKATFRTDATVDFFCGCDTKSRTSSEQVAGLTQG